MSNQWERYVEPAAEAMWESFRPGFWPRGDGVLEPIPAWADCAEEERESCRGEVRAALAVVGPMIVEDARCRMVEAAARAVEREAAESGVIGYGNGSSHNQSTGPQSPVPSPISQERRDR